MREGWEVRTSKPTTIIGADETRALMEKHFTGIDVESFGLVIGGEIGFATDIPPLGSKYRRKYEILWYRIKSKYEDWCVEIEIEDADVFFGEVSIRLREYAKRQYDDKKVRDLIFDFCKEFRIDHCLTITGTETGFGDGREQEI